MVDVLETIRQQKVVAVMRRLPVDKFQAVVEALLLGGITSVEITMDAHDAGNLIKKVVREYGSALHVGAGTVFTPHEAKEAVDAGAKFLVCPHLDVDLIEHAMRLDVPIVPGVMTPTEIRTAIKAGVSMVKVFPASVVGPGFIKDVLGPFAGLSIMVTGGLHEDNLLSYLQAGAAVAGLGSSLFPAKDLENNDWASITKRARRIVESVGKTNG